MSEIPENWVNLKLPEAVYFQEGPGLRKFQYRENGIPFLNIRTIQGDKINRQLCQYLDPAEVESKYRHFLLNEGDIICSTSGTIGKTAIVDAKDLPLMLNTSVVRFRTFDESIIRQRYLLYFLKSDLFLQQALSASTGSAQINVGPSHLKTFEFPVPPPNEQKRIADKLDQLLARVDACRERLDRIPVFLKRFRQAVLAAATSGQLTEDWRETSKLTITSAACLVGEIALAQATAKIKVRGGAITPQISDFEDEVELPVSWDVVGFDALAAPEPNALKAGPFGSALKKNMYVADGYKIYGQEQVISGDENFGDYFIDEQRYEVLSSCAVKPGDILVSLVGTIGKVLILSKECKPGIINPRLVKLTLHDKIIKEYISIYLRSPLAQRFFTSKSHGGTMDILNLGILRELPILLPSFPEQQEIIRRVEKLFAFADRLETRYRQARAEVDRLAPALLAKAFRGELVPQDPNDEPASALLERLRTERATAATQPKIRKPRGAGQDRPPKTPADAPKTARPDLAPDHLATLLKERGPLSPVSLWLASRLPMEDFEAQLQAEAARGLLREIPPASPEAERQLEAA